MVQSEAVDAGWRMSDNAPTPELVALLELSEMATPGIWEMYGGTNHGRVQTADVIVCDVSPPHFMGKEDAKFIAALVNWFRSTRAATVPQGVSEVRVLDRGFTFSKGVNVPTVLVGFAPEDWVSRDVYAAAIDAAMTPPPAELGEDQP